MKIEIETKKFRSNNLFSVFLVYPTRGLDIAFNYEGMNLKNVREISFFAGKHPFPEVTKEEGNGSGSGSATTSRSSRTAASRSFGICKGRGTGARVGFARRRFFPASPLQGKENPFTLS